MVASTPGAAAAASSEKLRRRKGQQQPSGWPPGVWEFMRNRYGLPFLCLFVLIVLVTAFGSTLVPWLLEQQHQLTTTTTATGNLRTGGGGLKSMTMTKEHEQANDGGQAAQQLRREEKEGESAKEDQEEGDGLVSKRFVMELGGLTTPTGTGTVVLETHPEWAPLGAAHFHKLVLEAQFYDECRFFRVLPNFIVQFGIAATPARQRPWRGRPLPDDPVQHSNERGTLTYAMAGKNTRTTQLFINKKHNAYLDKEGFAPFATVVSGMEFVDQINSEYKELPNQGKIQNRGNDYLQKEFPNLSYIVSLREEEGGEPQDAAANAEGQAAAAERRRTR